MLLYAFKKNNESNDKFILRYKKMFLQTRAHKKLRKERYFISNVSKKKLRVQAVIRELYRSLKNGTYES
jgi:hypothetical protein